MQIKPITAEEEFKKNPQLQEADMQHIRDWLEKQPHLPKVSDEQIILFLHSCEYKLEATKHTLETYFTIRTHSPELFNKRDPQFPEIQEVLEVLQFAMLPERDPQGNVVLLVRFAIDDASRFVHNDSCKTYFMLLDQFLVSQGTVPGIVLVLDFKTMTFGHLARLHIGSIKKYFMYIQDGMPAITAANHVINVTPVTEKLVAIMKPFMKAELISKLYVHQHMETFFKFIPKEILPREYGGPLEPVEFYHQLGRERLQVYRDWFLKEDQLQKVDETKRPGKAKSASDVFGMEGSFKKLDID